MSTRESKESFASLFEADALSREPEKARPLSLGERCKAEVVQIGRTSIFVEILDHGGRRPQAYLELEDLRGPDGQVTARVGEVIEAVVVHVDAEEIRLGRSMGRASGLDDLTSAHAGGVPIEGKVMGVNKGGLEVEVAGLRAFCPMSQIDRGFVADPASFVGLTLGFVVTELDEGGKRVVLSRRAVLDGEAERAAAETLARIAAGAVLRGTVTAVREFGAFVDLGGVEGLIPRSELSYERGARAADVLSPGDVVEVQVRRIEEGVKNKRGEETTKITLSLKALAADPWEEVDRAAPEGRVLRGVVTRVVDFGAFVQLAPGIEGLLHVSELGGKVAHPSAVLEAGESLNVVVRSLDREARKISLTPAPDGLDIGAEAKGPSLVVGAVVEGTVDRIEPFGVFLQVGGTRGRAGRGLIPNAELGTPKGADARKLFPPGTRLTAKVLETGEGRLRLSVRALAEDEERADFDRFRRDAAAPEKLGTLGDLFTKRRGS